MCEEKSFAEAMADVKPLRSLKNTVRRRSGIRVRRLFRDTEDEAQRLLSDFVEGKIEFEWSYHPDYQEGGPERKNRPLIKKLRRGGFSVQAQLDLHGLNREEAHRELELFLRECTRRRLRCVRIVHGKGKRSQDRVPVLKKMLPRWLSSKRIAPYVVAFTSAAPTDGGVGATYVLLGRK
jgi:DNA-nicking Smr family endonuclease